jgi:16S rRNA processing protein RimM
VPDQRHILIGRIIGAHGVKGALKLLSYAESLETFAAGRSLLLHCADGRQQVCKISLARAQGRSALLYLTGIETRSQAEALAGCDVFIDKATLPELEDGTYYWADLIGLDVYSADGRRLGRLASIFATGSNDVYVVRDGSRETLVPALKTVVVSVDLTARRMEVNLPEGLE